MSNPKEQQLQGNTLQTDQGIVVTSPAPLPNKLQKTREKMYMIALLCVAGFYIFVKMGRWISVLSGLFSMLAVVCLIVSAVCLCLVGNVSRTAEAGLRELVFRFVNNVESESLMAAISPVLSEKYHMSVQIGKNDAVTITVGKYLYEIHMKQDASFNVYWRMTLGKAVFMLNEYKAYCTLIRTMGIIVYEIQKAYGIQEQTRAEGLSVEDVKTEDTSNASKMKKRVLVGAAAVCVVLLGGELAESIVGDLSEQIEESYGEESNTSDGSSAIRQVGEPMTFNMNNGGMARITITGWEKKYEKLVSYDALSALSAEAYLIVNYEVENVGDGTICVNDSEFTIYADNYSVEQSFWEGDSMFGEDLAPGRKESGVICGKVDPDNVSKIEIQISNAVVVLKDESATEDENDTDVYEDGEGVDGDYWDEDSDAESDSDW